MVQHLSERCLSSEKFNLTKSNESESSLATLLFLAIILSSLRKDYDSHSFIFVPPLYLTLTKNQQCTHGKSKLNH